ncbi:MAG TPA: patatin-like phospholipase family protein, partial [Kofleriaceae bacterium]|nr:patatin-like phospholipase family protein [Kofleriaceae bacterium]
DIRTGLVLSGAAALGAYEAGVARYIHEEVARSLGRAIRFDVLSGTSAGGINAAALASAAPDPGGGAAELCDVWSQLRLSELVRPSAAELVRLLLDVDAGSGRVQRALRARIGRGGLLDPAPLERLVASRLSLGRISDNVSDGWVRAVALSTTHVATGEAHVFYQASCEHPAWPQAADVVPRLARLSISHALASAAIPVLFPPVAIDGDLYCDGGLRQLVPLSPAIHLGATRLVVVAPLPRGQQATPELARSRREAVGSPLYLAGKALNAFFFDRVEADLARLDQINAILRAGRSCFGPAFEMDLNDELARMGAGPIRRIQVLRIEPSRPLGALAIEHVTSGEFAFQARSAGSRLIECLAERDAARSGDLLAYLLFDGGFAARLVELGRADAAVHHDELCRFLAPGDLGQVTGGRSFCATSS